MTFDHDTGEYNVRGSLVAWVVGQITANRPPLVTTISVNFDHPEQPLAPPEWSVYFLGTNPDSGDWMGRYIDGGAQGQRRFGILEIDCWVSRSDTAWRAQLAQMGDVVTRMVIGTTSIPIRDFYENANNPPATGYRVMISRVEERQPPVDPNPDIERRRLLVYYNWTERV